MSRSYSYKDQVPVQNKPKLIMLMLVSFIVWSLALILLYNVADSLISWATTGGSALIDAGKSLAGKEVTTAFDALNAGQYAEPVIAFLRASLAPVLWLVWAAGVIIILLLPVLYRQLLNIRRMRRH